MFGNTRSDTARNAGTLRDEEEKCGIYYLLFELASGRRNFGAFFEQLLLAIYQ
jgi:hypothetical protein